MKTLTTNVAVPGPDGPVTLYKGQQLPDWAETIVGDHAVEEVDEETPAPARAQTRRPRPAPQPEDNAAVDEDGDPDAGDADGEEPDFTGPAVPRRRPRRKG